MKKRVAMLLSNPFRPDPRARKEAESLVGAGYEVTIIAWDRQCKFPQEDTAGGARIVRIRVKCSFGRGVRQMNGFARFWWRVILACSQMNLDVIHSSNLDTLIPGLVVAKLRRAKLVFDAYECYPLFFSARAPASLRRIEQEALHLLERSLCLFVNQIMTVSVYLGDHYSKFGKRVAVLHNCPQRAFIESWSSNPAGGCRPGRARGIVHIGGINKSRGLEQILRTLVLLRRVYQDVVFVNVGEIFPPDHYVIDAVRKFVREQGLSDVFRVTGWVEPALVPNHLREPAVGIILFQPDSYNNIIGLPNKLFEYMAAGVPVVASDFPSIGEVVREEECGLLVDPTDPQDIANKVSYLFENPEEARKMGLNGRRAAEEKYNWDIMEGRLLEVYHNL